MQVNLYDQKGKNIGNENVEDSVFKAEIKPSVLSQYVYSFLSNQREANAHTKNRAEVSGGGKKPWKQKGTGRARFGSSRNPIWRGGGVTFGPTNARNFKKKLTKKFKRAALAGVLSQLVKEDRLKVVNSLTLDSTKPLTKQAVEIKNAFGEKGKFVVVTKDKNDDVVRSFSNVPKSNVTYIGEMSVFDLITSGTVIMEQEAAKHISEKYKK